MFIFQTDFRNLDLDTKPALTITNYEFRTDDPVLAESIRKQCGKHLWEIPVEETSADKPKRGRPKGVKMVRDARTSEIHEEEK